MKFLSKKITNKRHVKAKGIKSSFAFIAAIKILTVIIKRMLWCGIILHGLFLYGQILLILNFNYEKTK